MENKMNDQSVEQEYQIKITKPSKYKKLDTWAESSGELSAEEIANIMYCDDIDTIQENIERKNKERSDLKHHLDAMEYNRPNILWTIREKVNDFNRSNSKMPVEKKY